MSKRKQIIELLRAGNLTHVQIAESLQVSRRTVQRAATTNNLNRYIQCPIEKCAWCKSDYRTTVYRSKPRKSKFCSKNCYIAWQRDGNMFGNKNPAWIDGGKHESELQKLRRTEQWKEWRKAVYERDNYTCQHCGQVGGTLHPHHIKLKSKYPELMFDINNGLTLCKLCHMKAHNRVHMPVMR